MTDQINFCQAEEALGQRVLVPEVINITRAPPPPRGHMRATE